jgi:hypothetical protein
MKFYLILMLTINGQPVERPFEFDSYENCRQAIVDVREGYGGIKHAPKMFCSPTATPFNPGRPVPAGRVLIIEKPTKGDM